jgi:hypothetical protein
MKKWFFSNKGDITSAMNFDEAKVYLQTHANAYGWNPSLTQWLPVSCIGDFANILPESDVAKNILPEELVQEFKTKQATLEANLAKLLTGFNSATKSLALFRRRIDTYTKLTANLSDDLKNNISGMEKQYATLEKKVGQIKEAMQISQKEIEQATSAFNQNASFGEVKMPIAPRTGSPISTPSAVTTNKTSVKPLRTNNIKPLFNESNKVAKPKLVKEQYVDELVDEIGDGIVDEIGTPAPTTKKVEAMKADTSTPLTKKEVVSKTQDNTAAKNIEEKSEPTSHSSAADKGIKGMFKSVFKTEAEDTGTMSMSERIRLASKG